MVRVLFADNQAAVRGCILRILADDPRVEVVGEAADFSEAITQAHKIRPDVLILDLYMPFEADLSLRELSAQLNSCGAGILGISFANDDHAKALARHMGAAHLLDKVELGERLIPAIMQVASSGNPLPPPVYAE